MDVIDGCGCDFCVSERAKEMSGDTAAEVRKLNERLDRYEHRVKHFMYACREVFDSKSFWYLLGVVAGSL